MRTQKNVVDYFPHDANASSGDTLSILEGLFGNDGYAFWFKLLEKLARTENHYIDINKDSKWHLFCSQVHITPDKAITIIAKLVELEAIDTQLWESGIIWSENLIKNIEPVYKNRRRELPSKPITTSRNGLTTGRKAITTSNKAITTSQSRVEYSRVEYSRIIIPDFVDKELWNDFLDMRKKARRPATLKAQELLIKDLEKLKSAGADPNEVIKQSIKNSWQSLFPLKGRRDDKQKDRKESGMSGRLPSRYTRPEEL